MSKLKMGLAALIVLLFAVTMTGCVAVQVTGELSLNSDGTGTRSIIGKIDKTSMDDNGITYYFLKQHGDDLKAWLEGVYTTEVPGSEEWLEINVNDQGAWETVTLTFQFSSFDEYNERLKALAYNEEKAAVYVEPVITMEEDKILEYKEDAGVMTAIMNSIHASFIADDSVYDNECTDEYGNSLTNGPSTVAETNGMTLMETTNGAGLTISVNNYDSYPLYSAKESEAEDAATVFLYTVPEEAQAIAESSAASVGIQMVIIVSVIVVLLIAAVVGLVVMRAKKKK